MGFVMGLESHVQPARAESFSAQIVLFSKRTANRRGSLFAFQTGRMLRNSLLRIVCFE